MVPQLTKGDKNFLCRFIYNGVNYEEASTQQKERVDLVESYGMVLVDGHKKLFLFDKPPLEKDPNRTINIRPDDVPFYKKVSFRYVIREYMEEDDLTFIAYHLKATKEWDILQHIHREGYFITFWEDPDLHNVIVPCIVTMEYAEEVSNCIDNARDLEQICLAAQRSLEKYEHRLKEYVEERRMNK